MILVLYKYHRRLCFVVYAVAWRGVVVFFFVFFCGNRIIGYDNIIMICVYARC